jgi:hypothetical protein
MPEKKSKTAPSQKRLFETDTLMLQVMELVATASPSEGHSIEEMVSNFKKPVFTPETIKRIVKTVKGL